jgi:hypothetical protein
VTNKVTEQKTDKKVSIETEIKISEWELIDRYISVITDYKEYNRVVRRLKRIGVIAQQLPISRDKILFVMKWNFGGTKESNNTELDVYIKVGYLTESDNKLKATKKLIKYINNTLKALSDYEKQKKNKKK